MKLQLKYIMIDAAFPILFAGHIEHKNMVVHGKITSAGFCDIVHEQVVCHGASHSLRDMGPAPLDEKIIAAYLGL